MDLSGFTVPALLDLHVRILDELRGREIIRSGNNPVADYTEYLVSKALGLELAGKSAHGFDAVDGHGARYQIKGRRLTPANPSTELSALRNLQARHFDFLVAVMYRADLTVDYAAKVPHAVVLDLAKFSTHTNAHRFFMRRNLLDDPRIVDITALLV